MLSAPVSGIRSAFSLSIGRIVERVIGPALVVAAMLATADAQQPAADQVLHRTVTYADRQTYIDRKSTRLNSSHSEISRMPSSA